MAQAGGVKIELQVTDDAEPTLAVDGKPVSVRPTLSWVDGLGRRHPLVWLRGERVYDAELWLDGAFVGYVPGHDGEVEAAYADAERKSA